MFAFLTWIFKAAVVALKVVAAVVAWAGAHVVAGLVIGTAVYALGVYVESEILESTGLVFIGAALGGVLGGSIGVWFGAGAGAALGPSSAVAGVVGMAAVFRWEAHVADYLWGLLPASMRFGLPYLFPWAPALGGIRL